MGTEDSVSRRAAGWQCRADTRLQLLSAASRTHQKYVRPLQNRSIRRQAHCDLYRVGDRRDVPVERINANDEGDGNRTTIADDSKPGALGAMSSEGHGRRLSYSVSAGVSARVGAGKKSSAFRNPLEQEDDPDNIRPGKDGEDSAYRKRVQPQHRPLWRRGSQKHRDADAEKRFPEGYLHHSVAVGWNLFKSKNARLVEPPAPLIKLFLFYESAGRRRWCTGVCAGRRAPRQGGRALAMILYAGSRWAFSQRNWAGQIGDLWRAVTVTFCRITTFGTWAD